MSIDTRPPRGMVSPLVPAPVEAFFTIPQHAGIRSHIFAPRSNRQRTIASVKTARDKILQTAADLFYASGVRAVGVDTVVEKSGVAKMTLYKHFPSKAALVNAVVAKQAEEFLAFLRAGLDSRAPKDPTQALLAVFDVLGEWFSTGTFRGCPFINVCMELGEGNESAATACRAAKRRVRELLVELARATGARDPVELADQAYLLVEGAIVSAAMWKTAEPASKAKKALAALIEVG